MLKLFMQAWKQEDGQALMEYALLGGLIAAVCVATITSVGTEANTVFQAIVTALKAA